MNPLILLSYFALSVHAFTLVSNLPSPKPTPVAICNSVNDVNQCPCVIGARAKSLKYPSFSAASFTYVAWVYDNVYQVQVEFQMGNSITKAALSSLYLKGLSSPNNYLNGQVELFNKTKKVDKVNTAEQHFAVTWLMEAQQVGGLECSTPFQLEYIWCQQSDNSWIDQHCKNTDKSFYAEYVIDCPSSGLSDAPNVCWEPCCGAPRPEPETTEIVESSTEFETSTEEITTEEEPTTSDEPTTSEETTIQETTEKDESKTNTIETSEPSTKPTTEVDAELTTEDTEFFAPTTEQGDNSTTEPVEPATQLDDESTEASVESTTESDVELASELATKSTEGDSEFTTEVSQEPITDLDCESTTVQEMSSVEPWHVSEITADVTTDESESECEASTEETDPETTIQSEGQAIISVVEPSLCESETTIGLETESNSQVVDPSVDPETTLISSTETVSEENGMETTLVEDPATSQDPVSADLTQSQQNSEVSESGEKTTENLPSESSTTELGSSNSHEPGYFEGGSLGGPHSLPQEHVSEVESTDMVLQTESVLPNLEVTSQELSQAPSSDPIEVQTAPIEPSVSSKYHETSKSMPTEFNSEVTSESSPSDSVITSSDPELNSYTETSERKPGDSTVSSPKEATSTTNTNVSSSSGQQSNPVSSQIAKSSSDVTLYTTLTQSNESNPVHAGKSTMMDTSETKISSANISNNRVTIVTKTITTTIPSVQTSTITISYISTKIIGSETYSTEFTSDYLSTYTIWKPVTTVVTSTETINVDPLASEYAQSFTTKVITVTAPHYTYITTETIPLSQYQYSMSNLEINATPARLSTIDSSSNTIQPEATNSILGSSNENTPATTLGSQEVNGNTLSYTTVTITESTTTYVTSLPISEGSSSNVPIKSDPISQATSSGSQNDPDSIDPEHEIAEATTDTTPFALADQHEGLDQLQKPDEDLIDSSPSLPSDPVANNSPQIVYYENVASYVSHSPMILVCLFLNVILI